MRRGTRCWVLDTLYLNGDRSRPNGEHMVDCEVESTTTDDEGNLINTVRCTPPALYGDAYLKHDVPDAALVRINSVTRNWRKQLQAQVTAGRELNLHEMFELLLAETTRPRE